ncbi:MAG: hypothetical protein MR661_02265 [Prevotella sp.]|nr:hypothetical protein [Prevotella sp.]
MKKITFSFFALLMAVLFLPSSALARETVTFDFAANPWGLPVSDSSNETAGNLGTKVITQDGVTFSTTDGSTATRLWNSGTAIDLRIYKSGGSFTFTAPTGKVIEKIEFTGSTVTISTEIGAYDSSIKTWTQPAEQVSAVTFKVIDGSKTNKITKAVLTIAAPGEAPEVVELSKVDNIAAFKALKTDTEAELTLTDAKVLYVNGKDMIVEDATGAIDFYSIGLTATAGQVLNGSIAGKNSLYNGLPQFAKSSNTDVATVTVADGDAPVAVEMTVAEAMAETSYLKYVKLTDATLVLDGETYYLVNGDNKIQIYNKFKLDYTLPDAIKSIAGIIIPFTKSGTTIVELAPIAVADIVAVDPDPEPEPEPEPIIADGTYYLYNEAGKVFFERGAAWGTQATVGKYGLPVDITTVNGVTTLAMHDWAGTVIGFDEGIYTDASGDKARTYTAKPVDGGFVFVNNNNYALTIADGIVNGVLDGEGTVWALKTLEERNAILDAAVAADKSAAFAAVGYPEDAEFETTDCTEKVASASLAGSNDGWTWTEVRKGNNATNENGTERYQATGTLSQTVTGLEPGLYRVTVNGMYRDGSNAVQVTMAADGYYNSTAYLAANGVQAQITPWAKDRVADANPNSMADYKAIIDKDATKYLSELYTTVGDNGELALSINVPSYIGGGWCIFSNVTLTHLSYTAPEPEPTLPKAGTYYLKNVATGKYLAGGSSWGTHAIVDAHGIDLGLAVLDDGKYTIDTQLSNGGEKHYLNGVYCDGDAFGWTFALTKTGAGENAVMISDGTNYLTTADGTDEVSLAANDDDYSKWVVLSAEDRMAELQTATADNGKDASWLLPGRNFGRNDLRNSKWTGKLSIGGDNTNMCAERFNTTFDVYQTISVPNGLYKVEVQGFYRNGGYADAAAKHVDGSEQLLAAVYANTAETPLQSIFTEAGQLDAGVTTDGIDGKFPNSMANASAFFSAGLYNNVVENVAVVDGTLTVGVRKSEAVTNDWSIFDNFRITYYGEIEDLTVYKEAYDAALAAAQAALDAEANAVVTGEERTALEGAITDNTTIEETKDGYTAATTALNAATSTFTSAVAAYQALEDTKAEYESFDTAPYKYASSTKKAAIQEAIDVEATSAADATAKKDAILTAVRDYVESNAVAEEAGATDFTSSILNPNAEDGVNSWTKTLGDGSGGEIKVLSNEPFTDAAGNSTHSYFDGGDWNASAWDVTFSQDVTLPSGEYLLSATTRASQGIANFILFGVDQEKEMPHVGNTGGIFNRGWNDNFVVFNVHEDNTAAKIGVRGIATTQHEWMSFTRFRLVRLGEANIINGIQTENLDNATIYSVNGQVVRTNATTTKGLAKGVYVVNGKKVVVK